MVNTRQPISATALEILALMRDQAEYGWVTISSTSVGNALCVTQETARRNMRSLVDMNLLEVVSPQKGALAATYLVPEAAGVLLDALNGVKRPVATRLDKSGYLCAAADSTTITIDEGEWTACYRDPLPLRIQVKGRAKVSVSGNLLVHATGHARVIAYAGVEVYAKDFADVRAYSADVTLYDHATGVAIGGGYVRACDQSQACVTGTTTLEAYDLASWHASDDARVTAGGRTRGTLTGRATARLIGEAVARASLHASVLLCDDAIADGGVQVPEADISRGVGVLDLYGAVRDGKAVLYKVLPSDLTSGKRFGKPTRWEFDSDVECDAWDPAPMSDAGLFLYPTMAHAVAAAQDDDAAILAVHADLADVAPVSDGIVKARRVHVVENVPWRW